MSERAQVKLVQQAIDMGCTVFDTADAYGAGASERVLGRAIRGRRDSVTVATKGGYRVRERSALEQRLRREASRYRALLPRRAAPSGTGRSHDPLRAQGEAASGQDFSPPHLRAAVDASLRRLGVDHIDVYQLHGAPQVDDSSMEALLALRDAGKIGAIGLGAETYDAVRSSLSRSDLDVVQLPFGLLDPDPLDGLFDELGRTGREIWIRGVLGGGLLGRAMADPNAMSDHPKASRIRQVQQLARRWDMPVDEIAIRWACTVAPADVVLVGIGSVSHLRRNLTLANSDPLPADTCAEITAAVRAPA